MVFRHLLGNWLRNAAKQTVREKVVEAARKEIQTNVQQAPAANGTDEPEPCRVGIVYALGIEAGGLADLLDGVVTTRGRGLVVRRGDLKGRRVALIIAGAGRENATRATEALISGHEPQWVLSAGFAGGLQPELKRHDILMVDRLVDTAGNHLTLDLKVDPASLAAMPGVHVGRLLTADRVIRLPEEKQSLGRRYDAMAVDMESVAVAEVCRRREVRFLAVRVINDAVDDELPHDVEHLLAQQTRVARLGATAGAIWRRPSSLKDMFRLKENAYTASDRLAKFLAGMIEQL